MPYFGIPIRNGLPIGLGSVAGFGIAPFSPESLFENGEVGAWYDPSDYSTLFTDSAGTTPVTGVEQFVGLMLDKSQGLVLGPELFTDFTSEGAWTDNGNGSWSITNAASTQDLRVDYVGTTNKRYVITVVVAGHSGSQLTIYPLNTSPYSAGNGSFTTRQNSNAGFFIIRAATGTSATVSNISVRELPGNHAFQTSSAKRPKLAARYNLLTYSEEFDNAAWLKSNLNTTGTPAWVNVAVAPDGTTTADKFIANVGTFRVDAANTTPVVVAQYSQTIYAQKDTYQYLWIGDRGDAAGIRSATFDLNSGTVLGQSNGTASIFDAGNGWWKCVLVYSRVNAGNASAMYALGDSSHTIDRPSKTWLGTEALNVWGADLRPASQATGLIGPTYQRVAAATVYDTAGFLPYLAFDGLDDSMSTNSIDFSAGDKVTVWAGVRKLSDASIGSIAELSADANSNSGVFWLFAPNAGGAANWNFRSRGNAATFPIATQINKAAPDTAVLTGIGDIAGDVTQLRYNNVVAATDTTDQGAGNYGNYPLYIGMRNNASLPFTGWLTSLIVRGAQSTQSQIEATEAWVNGKTGAY